MALRPHEVLWLQVEVDKLLGMQGGRYEKDLFCDLYNIVLRESLLPFPAVCQIVLHAVLCQLRDNIGLSILGVVPRIAVAVSRVVEKLNKDVINVRSLQLRVKVPAVHVRFPERLLQVLEDIDLSRKLLEEHFPIIRAVILHLVCLNCHILPCHPVDAFSANAEGSLTEDAVLSHFHLIAIEHDLIAGSGRESSSLFRIKGRSPRDGLGDLDILGLAIPAAHLVRRSPD
mmetsp:Transcript_4018/g.9390  ORF Transcript_4018/g.9390 Transcript_4018/m.9390 type:complete len:229 (-) Transcript_4018:23-709(-)